MQCRASEREAFLSTGDVEAVGDGRVGGKVREFTTKPGDTVLYSKFGLGATEVEVDGKEYILIREVRAARAGGLCGALWCLPCKAARCRQYNMGHSTLVDSKPAIAFAACTAVPATCPSPSAPHIKARFQCNLSPYPDCQLNPDCQCIPKPISHSDLVAAALLRRMI
jgi:hypothetical protein